MHTTELRHFLDAMPHGSIGRFAKRVGASRVYLSQLAARQDEREPSPQMCVVIERESGRRVMRWSLRPTDWHLIWPELINAAGAPPLPQAAEAERA